MLNSKDLKRALEICTEGTCVGCPYCNGNASCLRQLTKDARDYIAILELKTADRKGGEG